jgi:hypothetical protein
MVCADPRGGEADERFEDNEIYVGHDEPIVRFLSARHGSGNDVTWNSQLPVDPKQLPTVDKPGRDVTHFFELSVAPWLSMALCNPHSYPIAPCTPLSDQDAPDPPDHLFGGGGSSFLELQFYPPGFAPFFDSISCDNDHWCAALLTFDLMCTAGFEACNDDCIEPANFAFIQRDGVPAGPPSPQLSDLSTVMPNGRTLLMNPGDKLSVHVFDSAVPNGGDRALQVRITDLTTGQVGFMQASARNGFMATRFEDCSGTPFNYRAAYDTAKPDNVSSWTLLDTNISTTHEIGHFEPCKSITDPLTTDFGGVTDTFWQHCHGPYERPGMPDGGDNPEFTDAPCYGKGYTHHGLAPPNKVTGCVVFDAGGDVDFDGSSYRTQWPESLTPGRFPSPFLQQQPLTQGERYSQIQFQTTITASDLTCQPDGTSCRVPPNGADFYPFYTLAKAGGACVWELGQMRNGATFGEDAQYGGPGTHGAFNFQGPIFTNPGCA